MIILLLQIILPQHTQVNYTAGLLKYPVILIKEYFSLLTVQLFFKWIKAGGKD